MNFGKGNKSIFSRRDLRRTQNDFTTRGGAFILKDLLTEALLALKDNKIISLVLVAVISVGV